MHMALFGGLVWIVISFASKRPVRQIVWMSLGAVLLVGVVQETIQMVSVNTFNIGASLFDLGIDLGWGINTINGQNIVSKTRKKRC